MTRTDELLTVTYTYIVTMYKVISETVENFNIGDRNGIHEINFLKTPKFSVGRGYRIKHIKN